METFTATKEREGGRREGIRGWEGENNYGRWQLSHESDSHTTFSNTSCTMELPGSKTDMLEFTTITDHSLDAIINSD